jgi:import inner membrane translocase subunit TIM10
MASQQEKQLEAMAAQDMFKKLSGACFVKCVKRYDEGEVTVGEGACIERCVHKYLDAYKIVNDHLMAKQQQEMQQ